MRSRGSMARRLSGIGRGIRTRRRRRSRTCWRRADYSYGKHGLRSRVLREQMGRKNWDGCWSTWRPATEQEALEREKRKENRRAVATEPTFRCHRSGGVLLKLSVKPESEG